MKARQRVPASLLAVTAFLAAPTAHAIEMQAGDWKFSFSGNVNVHYIYSSCEDDEAAVAGGTACVAGGDAEDKVSTVSNGLLPAAFVLGASTTQKGWDISANFGLYPGISANDGGTPNLISGTGNTALATTGLDVRQVFMTFGNKDVGTFMLGRNFGLFGFDAIINDMTIPGVGGGGATGSGTPANTSLGSIGLGYIYVDTLAQMNYTTPDLGGLKLTIGIYDPLEPIGVPGVTNGAESAPGFHGKAAFTAGNFYLSASFIQQDHEGDTDDADFDSTGFDVGGKATFGPVEVMGWYYDGKGMGTTALFLLSSDGTGEERDSDGFLAQVTFKAGDTKFGLNYGESNLDLADGEANPGLVEKNSKYTVGVYHALTPNLTLLTEYTDVSSEAHGGTENDSSNFNLGAFMSF